MNFNQMKMALLQGDLISRRSWFKSKRLLSKGDADDKVKIGNISNINSPNCKQTNIEEIEAFNDGVDDWFIKEQQNTFEVEIS